MPTLRPVDHLESVARDYPGVWRNYACMLAMRGGELGDWPSWCYCPMAAAYAVVSGGGDNEVPISRGPEIGRVAALAAWRPTQGIYRFHPELLAELLESSIGGDLPTEHLRRLPEWCVYVEIFGESLSLHESAIRGFFAHLEHDPNDGHDELRLLLDQDAGLVPVALHLGSTIEASIAGFVAHANAQMAKRGAPLPAFGAGLIDEISRVAAPLVSVLLYLCARDAETRPTRDPKRKHRDGERVRRGRDGEPYAPPARRPEVWETGFTLGAALAAARGGEPRGGTVRGHVRRAHWHGYWMGSGDDRRLDVRWQPPIPVNLDAPPDPTVHCVRTEPRE